MPTLITFLIGALVSAVGHIVARVLLSLGFGYVTYTGLMEAVNLAKSQFQTVISGLPAGAMQLMGVLQIGTCLNIIVSALAARLIVAGLMGNSLTKVVTQG